MGPLNKRSEPLTKVFCIHFFILFTTFVETLSDRYHYVSIYLLLSRFAINLLNGTSPDDDIALHINPRRDQGEIVFNSRKGGSWEKEKRKKLPSVMEEMAPFTLEILAKSEKFKVTNKNCTNLSFSQRTGPKYFHTYDFQKFVFSSELLLFQNIQIYQIKKGISSYSKNLSVDML